MSSQRDPQSRSCACGCDGHPVAGKFLPGHDAKLRGKFLARIDDGDERAITEFLNDWPELSRNYGYTDENLGARLGRGRKRG